MRRAAPGEVRDVAEPEFDEAFRAKLHDLFAWRRDVRHFRSEPLDANRLEHLVQAAALSPSVGFSQPWRFVRVDDPGRRAAVIASFERANARALSEHDGEARASGGLLRHGNSHGKASRAAFDARDARVFGSHGGVYVLARGACRRHWGGLGLHPRSARGARDLESTAGVGTRGVSMRRLPE
jgi:nitroreductase